MPLNRFSQGQSPARAIAERAAERGVSQSDYIRDLVMLESPHQFDNDDDAPA